MQATFDPGLASGQSELSSDLSKRELQIVELVAAGLTNQEISAELDISKRTVDNHVSNVLNKTATGNRVALVRWALQSGKVCIDELNCCRLPENKSLESRNIEGSSLENKLENKNQA